MYFCYRKNVNLIVYPLSNQINIKKSILIKLFLLFSFCGLTVNAQDLKDIDSLLIDRDIENYSFRIFTNFKANKFSVENNFAKARFVPNNRHGVGIGVANKKIIVDIAFNTKSANKEATKKFDLQGTTSIKNRHYSNIYIQTYKGFKAKNNFGDPFVFRNDIHSVNFGLNYLYTFDDIEFSYALLKAGLAQKRHENVFITGGIGVFSGLDYFTSDASIFSETTSPYFNDEGNIKRYQSVAVGVLAGFVSYFKLPENITATVNVMPGMGVMYKKLTIQDGSYRPDKPMVYKLDFLVGLGYSFDRYYASLTYSNSLYSTDFAYDNNYRLNLTKAKLAIGYRFKSRKN
jgi:hypothetical protein